MRPIELRRYDSDLKQPNNFRKTHSYDQGGECLLSGAHPLFDDSLQVALAQHGQILEERQVVLALVQLFLGVGGWVCVGVMSFGCARGLLRNPGLLAAPRAFAHHAIWLFVGDPPVSARRGRLDCRTEINCRENEKNKNAGK